MQLRQIIFGAILFCGCTASHRSETVRTPDTDAKILVDQLASRFPPAHEQGDWQNTEFPPAESPDAKDAERVHHVIDQIAQLGRRAIPELVEASDDQRYSYSIVGAAWSNQSVADACRDLIDREVEGYPQAGCEGFKGMPDYIWHVQETEGLRPWWAKNKAKSAKELQVQAIVWAMEEDKLQMKSGPRATLYSRDLVSLERSLNALNGPTTSP